MNNQDGALTSRRVQSFGREYGDLERILPSEEKPGKAMPRMGFKKFNPNMKLSSKKYENILHIISN